MKSFRFTIARVLLATGVVSIFAAAIATQNIVLLVIASNLVWVLLLGSVLGAIYRPHPEQRAFWLGFAIFGWGFFVLHNPIVSKYLYTLSPLSQLFTFNSTKEYNRFEGFGFYAFGFYAFGFYAFGF